MYPNLEAEMKRRRITRRALGAAMNWAVSTTTLKLNGKSDISMREALKIRECVGAQGVPLEVLFATNVA